MMYLPRADGNVKVCRGISPSRVASAIQAGDGLGNLG